MHYTLVLKWLRYYGPDWLRSYRDKERPKSKWTEIAMVILTVATAGAAFYSARIFYKQFRTMQEQEQRDLMPFVDLSRATVFATPFDNEKPIAVLTLVNEGKPPAKKVRVISFMELHFRGSQLSPPRDDCFLDSDGNATFGPTYPSNSPQTIIQKMGETTTPTQRAAYEDGRERLYVYGRIEYEDFWSQDRPRGKPPANVYRSSIFCRSFAKENEELLRMKHPPEGAATMVPCTSNEWPFDDLFDDSKQQYKKACSQ